MKFTVPVRLRVEKDIIVRLKRSLKGKGQLTVSKRQEVTPSEIIGSSFISSGFRVLNLADLLSVSGVEAEKYLKRTLGQRIFRGELLAYKEGGFFGGKKEVISPTDGILDFLNPKTGELKMTFLPKKVDLPAGVYGIVEEVDEGIGQVIIRTQASLIYGIFGTGRIRDGILHLICKRDELLSKSLITTALNDQIIVGGGLVLKDAVSSAISSGISGIITGGINAKDYKSMAGGRLIFPKKIENDIGTSIVICEGFGSIPIAEDIYGILKKYDGKYVSIDGNLGIIYLPSFESSCMNKVKNTKLPEISREENWINRLVDLKEGLNVRVVGNSYTGIIGKLESLDQTETLLPSGIKTFMATVETRRIKIKVPVVNLEVMV